MATIGKIRKHSTLLLILVGGALALFVLSDFLGNKGGGKRPEQYDLAIVGDEKISAQDFRIRVDEQIELYKQQYGDNLNSSMIFQINEEVFNEIIRQTILKTEYEKIGLTVSKAEMYDMMTGVNIHPIILQNFTDPQTGQFNPAFVEQYLMSLDEMEPAQQQQWYALEKIMKEERYFTKYQTLVQKSYFFPKAMAVSTYQKQGKTATALIVSLKYSTLPDEDITLTDADYEKYYEAHKHEYEQEESRWLDYVIFDLLPSEKDIEEGEIIVQAIYNEFIGIPSENITENFMFANLKSDVDFVVDTNFIGRVQLPAQADSIFDMPIGTVVGPYSENNSYFMHKLLDREVRADSMKAAHILVAYQGAAKVDPANTMTKEQAQMKADSLLKVVKGTDSITFAQIAIQFSNDGSAQSNGGELGWFKDGEMVPEFNNACVDGKVGDYFIVESAYGFHVVHLTGKKNLIPKIKIAMLKYTIEASPETRQTIYTDASKFAGDNQSPEAFEKAIIDNNYVKRTSEYVRTSDYSLPGVLEGREIIRWAFNEDVVEGQISEVFDYTTENKNVVVIVRQVRTKGIAPLAQIKELIEPFVKKEKKAELLMVQMNQAKAGATSIEDIAKKMKVQVDTAEFVSFASPNIPGIGPEPKVVGTIFGTEPGKISRTIKGEAAIFVIQVIDIIEPPQTDDYSMVLYNQLGFFQNRVTYDMFNALLKKAEVIDNKIMFY